jgi:uncharacterized repeat protein (TIGR03803 family)
VAVEFVHVFGIDAEFDVGQPNDAPIEASDGNLYGYGRIGGTERCFDTDNFCGAIYRLSSNGDYTIVHNFGGPPQDGNEPYGRLFQASDGALYGLTSAGGEHGFGVAFKLSLDGEYTVLHSFGATKELGRQPDGGLIEASDGHFYGTTPIGGSHDCSPPIGGCGTLFRLTKAGEHTVLFSFGQQTSDGSFPNGRLLEIAPGQFIGTTGQGGRQNCVGEENAQIGCGTVFVYDVSGQMEFLYAFGQGDDDGKFPDGPLVEGSDGAFYGTTLNGGRGGCDTQQGCGTVFRIDADGAKTTLHEFSISTGQTFNLNGRLIGARIDGFTPSNQLILGGDGFLYGTTRNGGIGETSRKGTIFRISAETEKETLFSFAKTPNEPGYPFGGISMASDGSFYGTVRDNNGFRQVENRQGSGSLFRFTPPATSN